MKPLSLIFVLLCGAMSGFGLAFSTMIQPEVVLNFLRFHDLGLLLAFGGAVTVATLAYESGPRLMQRPVLEARFETQPTRGRRDTLTGAAVLGIGWGLCGVCPASAIAGLGAGNWPLLHAVVGIFVGAYLQGRLATGRWRSQPE